MEITAEAVANHELVDMSQRFWVGLVLTLLPVFILDDGGYIPALGLHTTIAASVGASPLPPKSTQSGFSWPVA